ncbi:hypothetical protein QFZ42_003312 [Variovorax paradoxus]|uniref:hypothetical protein n=1 Tax=Variovorax paradoxus TaxID=34073 RepID=UPI00278D10A1|nr:hypothetical protein [Variovorax paradoxus]MDQ0571478.1 hypothetical protein [Variovorax paradoxus]
MSVAWVGAGIAAVGTISQMDAAKGASSAQSGSSEQANAMQMMQQMQLRQDLAPWVQAGGAAQNRLNQYLGLGGAGSTGVTSMGLQTGLTPDQVRQQLTARFTRNAAAPNGGGASAPQYRNGQEAVNALGAGGAAEYFQNRPQETDKERRNRLLGYAPEGAVWSQGNGQDNDGTHGDVWSMPGTTQAGPSSEVDYEGLDAAIAKYYEEVNAQNAAAQADPTYGSLLRAYRNGEEFDSGPAFSFTGENLASDPGYKFGLDQGTQGIERGQASRGNFLSGGAMKELSRFNEDYAGTKFNDAYNRNLSTYSTNLNRRQNEWNTNLGAYNQNRNTIYNFLTGQSQIGQNSAVQVGAAGNQAATTMGNNVMAAGNANAAGQVASSNALVSGANSIANAFNSSSNPNSAVGWNNLLARQGGGYSGYTGYTGATDSIGDMNTQRGWTA